MRSGITLRRWVRDAFVANPADTLSQPHGKVDDGLETLNIDRHEVVTMSQDKFRVAQNACQRIVNLVAKQFTQFFRLQGGIVSFGRNGDL